MPYKNFQVTVVINAPAEYELDDASLNGSGRLHELTGGGAVTVPANALWVRIGGGRLAEVVPATAEYRKTAIT